jgi:hypothetical protein
MGKKSMGGSIRGRSTLIEVFVIVAGVLIALGVDEWRDVRRDAAAERGYVTRLIRDLQSDAERSVSNAGQLRSKLRTLERLSLSSQAELVTTDELREIARDLAESRFAAWGVEPTQRVTFDEMLSAGSLSLIRDFELRQNIAEYYLTYEFSTARLIARMTSFPGLSYRIIPRGEAEDHSPGTLSGAQLSRLRSALSTTEFIDAITAETNRTMFHMEMTNSLLDQASDLQQRLEEYLAK